MSSYFVTIYAQTRAASRERLAVGLLMAEQGKEMRVHLRYSENKVNLVRDLAGKEAQRHLRWSLQNLEAAFASILVDGSQTELFSNDKLSDSPLSKDYLGYLSTYQNNFLQFGKPSLIDLPASQANFDWLFAEQVDEVEWKSAPPASRLKFAEIGKRAIIKDRFNLRVRADQRVDPAILFPTYVDLLGKNGVEVYGKAIDTTRPNQFVTQDAVSFYGLAQQTEGSKHFVISQEPDKLLFPKQHLSWNNLRNSPSFEYVDVSEIEIIEQFAEKNRVKPFFAAHEEE